MNFKFRLLQGENDHNYRRHDSGQRHVFEITNHNGGKWRLHFHKSGRLDSMTKRAPALNNFAGHLPSLCILCMLCLCALHMFDLLVCIVYALHFMLCMLCLVAMLYMLCFARFAYCTCYGKAIFFKEGALFVLKGRSKVHPTCTEKSNRARHICNECNAEQLACTTNYKDCQSNYS